MSHRTALKQHRAVVLSAFEHHMEPPVPVAGWALARMQTGGRSHSWLPVQALELGLKVSPVGAKGFLSEPVNMERFRVWEHACGHTQEITATLNYCDNAIDLFAPQEPNSLSQGLQFSWAPGEAAGLSVTPPHLSPPSDISISFCQACLYDKINWTHLSHLRDVIKP